MLNTTNMAFIQSLSQFISGGMSIRRDPVPSPYILSTSPPDSTMELYVQEHKLQVCSIPKDIIAHFCYAVIRIALLPDSRPHFFSITETKDEYTLIVTEEDFRTLPKHARLTVSGYLWRVLTVSVGAMGASNELMGVSKFAKSVISPLADNNISVLCLSTYQSDFILVQEAQLDQTIRCLGSHFKVFNEDHQRVNVSSILSASPTTPTLDKVRPVLHPYHSPDVQYHVTGLDASKLSGVIQVLLELIFFSRSTSKEGEEDHSPHFFHFSVVCGDISLVLDNEGIKKFPNNVLYTRKNEEIWRMIKIGESSLGFVECGIVAQIVEPLAIWQISTYYFSTFKNEYCMVLERDIDRVLEILDERKKENLKAAENLAKNTENLLIDNEERNSTRQDDAEEKECRPGENMIPDPIEITGVQGHLYDGLSSSPISPGSDDSSYGTSPIQSDTDMPKDLYKAHSTQNLTASEPIPIPLENSLPK